MKRLLESAILFIASILLIVLPLNLDCAAFGLYMEDGSYMGCHSIAIVLTIIGVVCALFVIVSFIANIRVLSYALNITITILSAIGLLIVRGIISINFHMKTGHIVSMSGICPHCHAANMANVHNRFILIHTIILAIMLVISIIGIVARFLRKNENER